MPLLHTLPSRFKAKPQAAVRVIADTNVAAPALRWLARTGERPQQHIVDAFGWMQRCAHSSRISQRDVRLDLQWAAHETSRAHGRVSGEHLAGLHAANVVLLDWLFGTSPIAGRFTEEPPRLKASRTIGALNHGEPDQVGIGLESVHLVLLSALHRQREDGQLRGVNQRLAALDKWAEQVEPLGAVSADMLLIAIQTALAGPGAPARAMCKFSSYRDPQSARAAAANAAWDLQYLRLMRASDAGLGPFADHSGLTTLLTFDRQLAAASEDLLYVGRVDVSATTATFVTQLSGRTHLQNDVLRDARMLQYLDDWCRRIAELQQSRFGHPRPVSAAEDVDQLLDEALTQIF